MSFSIKLWDHWNRFCSLIADNRGFLAAILAGSLFFRRHFRIKLEETVTSFCNVFFRSVALKKGFFLEVSTIFSIFWGHIFFGRSNFGLFSRLVGSFSKRFMIDVTVVLHNLSFFCNKSVRFFLHVHNNNFMPFCNRYLKHYENYL